MCPSCSTEATWVACSVSEALWWVFPAWPQPLGMWRQDEMRNLEVIWSWCWRHPALRLTSPGAVLPSSLGERYLAPFPSSAFHLSLGYRSLGGMYVGYPVCPSFTLAGDLFNKGAVILTETSQHDPCADTPVRLPCSPLPLPLAPLSLYVVPTFPCCFLSP